MCGIAGYMSFESTISKELFSSMLNKTKHRGPANSNIFSNSYAHLGHNRLKIIDLTDNANQPMHSHNQQFVITYNGEVYNYEEIAKNFNDPKSSNSFSTNCDTEIVLEQFVKKGIDCLNDFNGMFAMAILDKQKKELYLAIDRIGIKPLYYYWDGKQLAFASELKSIVALKNLKLTINKTAINLFLHLGFIPAPHSIYQNVFKLEPGNYIKFNNNGFTIHNYWNINDQLNNTLITDEKKATNQLAELIGSSVKYRLRSDVPFGVFLSGGIDSSLVASTASSVCNEQINTFTIGFKESKFNESDFAKRVASTLKTNHNEFIVSHNDAIELVDSIITCFDEPFSDSSCLPTMLVSKMASKYATVVLSGEGGDELFHGYGAYKWATRLSNPALQLSKKPISILLNQFSNRYKRISRLLNYDSKSFLHSHIYSQEQYYFTENELSNLLSSEFQEFPIGINEALHESKNLEMLNFSHRKNRKLSPSEKQSLFDLLITLPGDLLTKIDRSTMKYSIEGRVPLLDHRIIEFALNIDPSLKNKNGEAKYLLKKVLYNHLPEKLFDRPKQGFALPIKSWLNKELKYLIEDNLSQKNIERFNIFNYKFVENLISQFYSGNEYLFNRIWALIIMQLWLKNNYKN